MATDPRGRGQLPKAYLRLDPNVDRAKSDTRWAFIRLLCEANRQPRRGQFKSRVLFDALLGKAAARKLIAAGDARELTSGTIIVPGWQEWQEGDITVAERQRRIRARRDDPRDTAVTSSLPDRIPTPVAPTPTSTTSDSGSKALGVRQQGSKAPSDASMLQASELPSETDSATLACRQLFDSGKWLGDREYVAAWEDMDRRYSSEWVQAEIAPAFAACLEKRGKVLPWDLKRMTESLLAERSRAEEQQRERADRQRLETQATQTHEPLSDEERERQSLLRRAIRVWTQRGMKGPEIPEKADELREWLAQNGASA